MNIVLAIGFYALVLGVFSSLISEFRLSQPSKHDTDEPPFD
jgi:hypothetical protein